MASKPRKTRIAAALCWSGSGAALLSPRPPRTARATFTACSSSIGQRAFGKHAVVPIGLGADLGVTAAVPATEMTSVAAVAPVGAVAAPPTYLQHSLRRLADGSRPPTPEGSQPPFGWGDVAIRLNPCPARYRPAFACSLLLYPQPRRLVLRPPYPWGGLRAYHVPLT